MSVCVLVFVSVPICLCMTLFVFLFYVSLSLSHSLSPSFSLSLSVSLSLLLDFNFMCLPLLQEALLSVADLLFRTLKADNRFERCVARLIEPWEGHRVCNSDAHSCYSDHLAERILCEPFFSSGIVGSTSLCEQDPNNHSRNLKEA